MVAPQQKRTRASEGDSPSANQRGVIDRRTRSKTQQALKAAGSRWKCV